MREMMGGWRRLGEREYVRTESPCAVNLGLVVGEERALLVDLGAGPNAFARHLRAVREITELPLVAALTHAHHDHAFGLDAALTAGVEEAWAHEAAIAELAERGEAQRGLLAEADGEEEMRMGDGAGTRILAPEHAVGERPVDVDLGGHAVTLSHLGRAHTSGDLVVASGSVLFVGDLVEEGAPPAFEDAFPSAWLRVLGKLIAMDELYSVVVPGHGESVDADEVRGQYHRLARAIDVAERAVSEAPSDATKSIPVLPFGPLQSRNFLERFRAERAGA